MTAPKPILTANNQLSWYAVWRTWLEFIDANESVKGVSQQPVASCLVLFIERANWRDEQPLDGNGWRSHGNMAEPRILLSEVATAFEQLLDRRVGRCVSLRVLGRSAGRGEGCQ